MRPHITVHSSITSKKKEREKKEIRGGEDRPFPSVGVIGKKHLGTIKWGGLIVKLKGRQKTRGRRKDVTWSAKRRCTKRLQSLATKKRRLKYKRGKSDHSKLLGRVRSGLGVPRKGKKAGRSFFVDSEGTYQKGFVRR